jgi:spore germination protein YaaH
VTLSHQHLNVYIVHTNINLYTRLSNPPPPHVHPHAHRINTATMPNNAAAIDYIDAMLRTIFLLFTRVGGIDNGQRARIFKRLHAAELINSDGTPKIVTADKLSNKWRTSSNLNKGTEVARFHEIKDLGNPSVQELARRETARDALLRRIAQAAKALGIRYTEVENYGVEQGDVMTGDEGES